MTLKERQKVRTIFRTSTGGMHKIKIKILSLLYWRSKSTIFSQQNLANQLKIPKTTLNYHFVQLKRSNLIDNFGSLTIDGSNLVRSFNHWDKNPTTLRAHKIQISINILNLPPNFFKLKHKMLKPFTNRRYKGLKGILQGTTLIFYSTQKLVIKLRDIFANTNEEIVGAIEECISQAIDLIQMEFPGIKLGNYEICKFNSMHCAILNSTIAKNYLLKKGSTMQSDEVCIDGSHGVPELEVERLNNIFENTNVLLKYEELVKENERLKVLIKEHKELPLELTEDYAVATQYL